MDLVDKELHSFFHNLLIQETDLMDFATHLYNEINKEAPDAVTGVNHLMKNLCQYMKVLIENE